MAGVCISSASKQFYATRDVPVLERVFGFYAHLFEFDNTGWVKDKTNPNLKRYIRIENDPAIGWSVVGSGTKHKYLLYFLTVSSHLFTKTL